MGWNKIFTEKREMCIRDRPGDTPEVLQRRVMEQAEWKLLPQAVAMLCEQLDAETGN